ncbi:unnamed protein product [Caenorhabditis angaria]|uniref:FOG-3 n=1 Tax=Caenorhabditis angaria TaxID=860376 RepID=Q6E3E2_9PELO|nr:FOG-3 [Caenorhabditis angaria]AAT72459.1 FOG-3 [Caenorhabditis angaria]CAI5440507.1 unnamed protein product [Caenorhabditis angaria]
MYVEVRELVNFLSRYLFGKQPRRPTGIFSAELGNFLVAHYAGSGWNIMEPKVGEKERCILIKCKTGTTNFIEIAIRESGLDYREVMDLFPDNFRIYANPGQVFARLNDNGIDIPIWIGDVNSDENYQPIPEYIVSAASTQADNYSNFGAAGKPILIGRKPLPISDRAVQELINGFYVPLALEESDLQDANSNLHPIQVYRHRYVFKPPSSQTFTGLEFSQTRFGSSKPRPDLQTMLNIKQVTAAAACSSSPPNESTNGVTATGATTIKKADIVSSSASSNVDTTISTSSNEQFYSIF